MDFMYLSCYHALVTVWGNVYGAHDDQLCGPNDKPAPDVIQQLSSNTKEQTPISVFNYSKDHFSSSGVSGVIGLFYYSKDHLSSSGVSVETELMAAVIQVQKEKAAL